MKYLKSFFLTILAIFYSNPSLGYEHIIDYHSDIYVLENGKIDVTEHIAVEVENNRINLGIYRDLPTSYVMNGTKYKTPVKVLSVERDGVPENFWIEKHGSNSRIQIGPKYDSGSNKLSKGSHIYKIRWLSQGHLRPFKDYDELYFNVTGNNWDFEIARATAKVVLPENVKIKQVASYYGPKNSTNQAISAIAASNVAIFSSLDKPLLQHEGLTIAVGFTKDIIPIYQEPDISSKFIYQIVKLGAPFLSPQSASLLLITFGVLIYYLIVWTRFGKDEDLGVVTPIFNSPDSVSPAKASIVWNGKRYNEDKTFFASIISLASQGFIKINDKSISKVKNEDKTIQYEEEKEIYDKIFSTSKTVSLGKYNAKVSSAFRLFTKVLKKWKDKYIKTHNKFIWYGIIVQILLFFVIPYGKTTGAAFGVIALLVLFYSPFYSSFITLFRAKSYMSSLLIAAFIIPHSVSFIISMPAVFISGENTLDILNLQYFVFLIICLLSILLHFLFYYLMDKPSIEANKILKDLYGLKMFMDTVEKERYQKITPSIFEKNLPYAIVFGMETKWFEKIKELYPTYTPDWYDGKSFSASSLSHIGSSFSNSRINPSSLSSGRSGGFSSSGSSGGGRSGGGSGGGGGGGR